jgi:cytochrome bd-type quinol oxidase subunit 2
MKKHFKTLSSLIVMVMMLILPYFIFAQTSGAEDGMLGRLNTVAGTGGYVTDPTVANLPIVIGMVVQAVLSLLGAIFIILMVYAGYTWMTASGNEPKIDKAKDMIQTAIIGLVIVLASWAVWTFIFKNFIAG